VDDKFVKLKGQYVRSLRALILTYDVNNIATLDEILEKFDLSRWKEYCVYPTMPRYIIGLKTDLENVVGDKVGDWIKKQQDVDKEVFPDDPNVEVWKQALVSAKKGEGLDGLLSEIVKKLESE